MTHIKSLQSEAEKQPRKYMVCEKEVKIGSGLIEQIRNLVGDGEKVIKEYVNQAVREKLRIDIIIDKHKLEKEVENDGE